MYRVKAEAVSGTKVFAGGKWLKCIGNKKVRVGEYIWTDGRCVYGNYQESQQPLVITAPQEDEAIPIVLSPNANTFLPVGTKPDLCFYTFKKGKLHLEAKTKLARKAHGIINDKPIMLNDYKKKIFFRDYNIIDNENGYIELLAANINRSGERFEIIAKTSNDGEACSVEIKKNGVAVKTFDIAEINTANIWDECPAPPLCPFTRADINEFRILDDAFIEDEKNWRFAFTGTAEKAYSDEYTGPYDGSGSDPSAPFVGQFTSYYLSKTYLVTAEGFYLISRIYAERIDSDGGITEPAQFGAKSYPEAEKVKFALQDGYYYKWRLAGTSDYSDNYYYSDFFTPTGRKIFSTEIVDFANYPDRNCHFLLQRISNNTYLFSVQDIWAAAGGGLWIIRNGNATQLLDRSQCFNQRLRPIKKYRGWQKRLQELTIE